MRRGNIKAIKKIPRKRKIQIATAFLIILTIVGILIANKFFDIFAAENDIINTATIYYNEDGVDKSAQSNTVITELVSPPPSGSTINIRLQLQGRTDHSTMITKLTIFQPGGADPVFEKSDIVTDTSGEATITVSLGTANYDYKIKTTSFLGETISNQPLTSPLALDFGQLAAGDLNGDGIVNSIDFSTLANKWNQNDPISDINKDGIVNSIDFTLLNGNWFGTDS